MLYPTPAGVDEIAFRRARVRMVLDVLAILSRREMKGYGWSREMARWWADLIADVLRLRVIGG